MNLADGNQRAAVVLKRTFVLCLSGIICASLRPRTSFTAEILRMESLTATELLFRIFSANIADQAGDEYCTVHHPCSRFEIG
jgi:hypothetical protein